MADYEFKLGGAEYRIDAADFTGSEHLAFRQAIGVPLVRISEAPFEGCLGLVWLLQRRKSKGLPFTAVADKYTLADFDQLEDGDDVPDDAVPEDVSPEA